MVWLVAGLGNPGSKYANNRHNVGFHVIDELASRHGLGPFRAKLGAEVASGLVAGQSVILAKPMEFMNRSGFAIQRHAQYRDIAPEHVLVVHDEIDIDFGRIKAKCGGGHGGHNGLRSIIAQLGSRDFARIRVGVGKPPGGPPGGASTYGDKRVASYVLSDFPGALANDVRDVVHAAADAVEITLKDGVAAAMNEFNGREIVPVAGENRA
jgi:peptidyl-tRNA hydrolase, PTH1 family